MLNASTSFKDELLIALTREPGFSLEIVPAGAVTGAVRDNLVFKAWGAFWSAFGCLEAPCGLRVVLEKRIPLGGGLGGGSSDAAAVIRFLARNLAARIGAFLGYGMAEIEGRMQSAALSVGADVPYAYRGGLCWVTGIGDEVRSVELAESWPGRIVIMVPPVSVPTAEFYAFFRERCPNIECCEDSLALDFFHSPKWSKVADLIENDFERVCVEFRPEVGRALGLARSIFPKTTAMTGSGSAIFSLVEPDQEGQIEVLERVMRSAGVDVYCGKLESGAVSAA
jgi:4-diphosphocytidyl-2-C-methyl-D-erythritol kinase